MNIAFTENTHPGTLPPSDQLGFGSVFTDHMFLMDYSAGKGGPLVAYRWSGEERLSSKNFVTSPPKN